MLIAVAITSLVAWFGSYKGSMVGVIPSGLPSLFSFFDLHVLIDLMPGAITLVLVGLMEDGHRKDDGDADKRAH